MALLRKDGEGSLAYFVVQHFDEVPVRGNLVPEPPVSSSDYPSQILLEGSGQESKGSGRLLNLPRRFTAKRAATSKNGLAKLCLDKQSSPRSENKATPYADS